MWRKESKRSKKVIPVKGASPEMLALVLQQAGEDAKIEAAEAKTVMVPDPLTGQAVAVEVYDAKVCAYEERKVVKVEAFPPEELLIKRDWTSPMLGDCPYVARMMRVTLSDLAEMGFDEVTAADLTDSDSINFSADKSLRDTREGVTDSRDVHAADVASDDESQTEGWLRIEFVLVDFDGDGIVERRCIYRLKNKILANDECEEVPIATASPILNPHRWDGLSVAETVSDLQRLRTELTRQMVNSAVLANNPRTKVLTDSQGNPLADIDDLLTSAPGRILRQRAENAIQEHVTPWVGGQMFPMLEYIDFMREQRTGVSRAQQGIDANALRHDRTAAEVMQTANAAAARIELIARIFAETLVKPIFKGIFRLLAEGDMGRIAFRLRNEFVQYDPSEWRDGYDMTINVGLGTGDKGQQAAILQAIFQQQGALMQSPLGGMMIKPKNVYNTVAKIVENAGFKNVGDFYADPGDAPMPQPSPPPQLALKQMELQADAQKFQAETQRLRESEQLKAQAQVLSSRGQLELQAANDQRDAERALLIANHDAEVERMKLELDRYKTDADNATRIQVALIQQQGRAQVAAHAAAAKQEQASNDGSADQQPGA
jgi:hypothetical protein